MATYELKRSEVRDAIVDALMKEQAIVEVLKWEESEIRDIASDICDDLNIDDDELATIWAYCAHPHAPVSTYTGRGRIFFRHFWPSACIIGPKRGDNPPPHN